MFLISLQGKESIFEQIRSQIIRFIQTGILKPDDKLPSVRNLAGDLGINPNTVMKAYQELEKEGYIYTLNKKGVFVADKSAKSEKSDQDEIRSYLMHLKKTGATREEILEVLNSVYEEEIC